MAKVKQRPVKTKVPIPIEPVWTQEAIDGAAQSLSYLAQVPPALIDTAATEILKGSDAGRKVIDRAARAALGKRSETMVLEYDLRILTDAKILMEGRSS